MKPQASMPREETARRIDLYPSPHARILLLQPYRVTTGEEWESYYSTRMQKREIW